MGLENIISIQVEQEYFKDGLAKNLIFEPVVDTVKLLKQYAFKVKYMESGIDIFAIKVDTHNSIPLTENLTFEFNMFCSDPYLRTHTKLYEHPTKSILYSNLNNLESNASLRKEYVDKLDSARDMRFIAKIQLVISPDVFRKSTVLRYDISWESESDIWKYYYIGRLNFPSPEIEHNEIQFEKQAILKDNTIYKEDKVAQGLFDNFPEAQHWMFTSSDDVVWKSEPYKDIKLIRDSEIIIPHLPNPRKEENGQYIINALTN